MMYKLLILILVGLSLIFESPLVEAKRYGERYCQASGFYCIRIQNGDSWERLWPNARERQVVRKLNRMNIPLHHGMKIAVPHDLSRLTIFDVAPFPSRRIETGSRYLIVDLSDLAWGAYDEKGHLLNWGPISGGKSYCADVKRPCRTITGSYRFYTTRGPSCSSFKYPLGKGGAPMPYCLFFYRGFAIHGSSVVPGYHASHGCLRSFNEDAKWLNEQFVHLPKRDGVSNGTLVVIRQ